ncbi:hypothetical protein [Fictibacillus phosphorivorans]|uniref:Uncharacterized protein n=1 Tax=Fictibacillus phosphorivorans TaxID=1221500 RepID=A0A160IJQ7_9BACL|nr:hypothetical protein [Fictibacillus phosphorivorans]ANC76047.1 hypothetical protein ABE65_004165 [Fictibacillus phosphorivorans]MQR97401.1 hypothetical protein [Fictibacillus phosphorivorans]
MYVGNTIKVDRYNGEYVRISQKWLMEVVWNKYNMPLHEFLLAYDKSDSDYIMSLAEGQSIQYEIEHDEDYLYIG